MAAGYLSPYFPAQRIGRRPRDHELGRHDPRGDSMYVKARWVNQNPDGSLRFLPWASIIDGKEKKLSLIGKGDFFQYYVNFVRFTYDAATPVFSQVLISIPGKEPS